MNGLNLYIAEMWRIEKELAEETNEFDRRILRMILREWITEGEKIYTPEEIESARTKALEAL